MALVAHEDCVGCPIDTCVCRECGGGQAEFCTDLDGNQCVFDGKITCLWYQENVTKNASRA